MHRKLTQAFVDRSRPREVAVDVPGLDYSLDMARKHPGMRMAVMDRENRPIFLDGRSVVRDGQLVRYKHTLFPDGGNLYLQVRMGDDGTTIHRSWLYRSDTGETNASGKRRRRWMGLGSAADLTLADARTKAAELRRSKLVDGIRDPLAVKQAERMAGALAKAKKPMTFDECRDAFLADNHQKWRNARHAAIWGTSLEQHVSKVFGHLNVADVDQELVIQALRPLMKTKPETGRRVMGRIETVLAWAAAHNKRPAGVANPASWKLSLRFVFPKRRDVAPVVHMRGCPWRELPQLMASLQQIDGVEAAALIWTILTGARTGTVLKSTWSAIDEGNRIWSIPAADMKRGNAMRCPISDDAMAVLARCDRDSKRLFPVGEKAMREVLAKVREGLHVHGFRQTMTEWATFSGYDRDLIDEQLGHAVGGIVHRSYRLSEDWLERRRAMVSAFGAFAMGRTATEAGKKVVSLRA
jgi:integrase